MVQKDDYIIIGVDHGYQNMKTANCCFRASVDAYDAKPAFTNDLLVYNGKYYLIGGGHKEFIADKWEDEDYYILTLAAIAEELETQRIRSARVVLAAGVPLTWVRFQRDQFRDYLMKNNVAEYTFRGNAYRIEFLDVEVFPQGFAAIVPILYEFNGTTVLCDIGSGTMNIMYVIDQKPAPKLCFTEKFGTYQCTLLAREKVMQKYHIGLDESIVTQVLRTGDADIAGSVLETIRQTAREYTDGIFERLREHEYSPETMRLYVVGGGGCLIKNFGQYDEARVKINEDICATAKGYEYACNMMKEGR